MLSATPVILTPATNADLDRVASLLKDYIAEMAAFMKGGVLSPSQQADAFDMMTAYWQQDDHYPFLIARDRELAGFALVRRYPGDKDCYDMGQFFIIEASKGMGLGREAFRQALARFPGNWIVRVLVSNVRAFNFWNKVIDEATRAKFSYTVESEHNTLMHFFRFRAESDYLPGNNYV